MKTTAPSATILKFPSACRDLCVAAQRTFQRGVGGSASTGRTRLPVLVVASSPATVYMAQWATDSGTQSVAIRASQPQELLEKLEALYGPGQLIGYRAA